MIIIKNKAAIAKMEIAARKLAEILQEVAPLVKEGVTTLELDTFVVKALLQKGLTSRCKGYLGYQHVTCISVNDEVVHGVPKKEKVIHRKFYAAAPLRYASLLLAFHEVIVHVVIVETEDYMFPLYLLLYAFPH